MAARQFATRLAQLWQIPLFLASLGLFGYAAFLFIDPHPGPTIAQRIDSADAEFKANRYESALAACNKLLASAKLKPQEEGRLHLLVAATLDAAQRQQHLALPSNYRNIIEQTQDALDLGVKPTVQAYRLLGSSHEALDNTPAAMKDYQSAIALDAAGTADLQKKLIESQLQQGDGAAAEAGIVNYLKLPKLAAADRAWAMSKRAQALALAGKIQDASKLFEETLALDKSKVAQGTAHYWLGYCKWKLGDAKNAERLLRVARDQLTITEPLDAEAAYLLGKIRQADNDPKEAISFYQSVLMTHPESRPAPLARLNRGICRIMLDDDPAGLSDLHEIVNGPALKKVMPADKNEAIGVLQQASALLKGKADLQGALEAMEEEQAVVPEPAPDFYSRLASVLEERADQLEASIDGAADSEKSTLAAKVRKLRHEAGDAYIALSRGMVVADDRAAGDALWKGVNLYDRAGATQDSIEAMETFVAERPSDGKTPDVLLRLGRAYQATGQFDKAIKKFQQNQFHYGQSLAAIRSAVPLAQVYMAKGPEFLPKAEKTLLSLLENNPILTPESEEFRLALFELAQLYYRTGRYEEAISRLEETTQRYPNDPRMGQLLFLMADSYRKSAWLLNAKIDPPKQASATQPSPAQAIAAASARAEAAAARQDRLQKAKAIFDRVVELARTAPPKDDLDRLYLKLAHFYRADCLYDLGQYEEAIRLYDAATLRYQDDPTSVSAYVQIVNAYVAMRRFDDARTANERAKWLLRRMPADAFEAGRSAMPKKYWDDWLNWTGESGAYAKTLKSDAVSDAR